VTRARALSSERSIERVYEAEVGLATVVEVVEQDVGMLAKHANEEHRLAEEHAQKALIHAIRCGGFLCAAKEAMAHGDFLPWLADNFAASRMTASKYMKTYLRRDKIANVNRELHLSIRGALEALREIDAEKSSEILSPRDIMSPDQAQMVPLAQEDEVEAVEVWRQLKAEYGDRVTAKLVKRVVRPRLERLKQQEEERSITEGQAPMTHAELADLNLEVRHCDFRELDLPDESIDVIITDPPYPAEYLPLFDDLGYMASLCLKPGDLLAVMVGQSYLPLLIEKLSAHLTYHWTLAYLTPGGQSSQLWTRKVNTFWKPILCFAKGEYDGGWFGDVAKSAVNDNDKEHHYWGQSESGMTELIERFSKPGDVILDPFLGGGTSAVVSARLNRAFIGCDLDSQAVETTLKRLKARQRATL
jgi:hypothetical protein